MRAAACTLLVFLAFGCGGARAADTQLFQWSMPAGFGEKRDDIGRLQETNPDAVGTGPWKVLLQPADALCASNVRLAWTASGGDVVEAGDCAYEATFPDQGPHEVSLSASGAIDARDTQRLVVTDRLIVSIGDSVASGEALPDIPSLRHARWQSERCHRSARSGTALAAARIEGDDTHSSVTFVHLACSGAEIREGLLEEYAGVVPPSDEPRLPPQVDVLNQIVDRRVPDAVLLSIGANDVGFGPIVTFCLYEPQCFSQPFRGEPSVSAYVSDRLKTLRTDFADLDARISDRIPRGRIVIVDYFDPTRTAAGKTCPDILGGVTSAELTQAQDEILTPLNNAVKQAAHDHGWQLVSGNADRFREHGYCAGTQSWVTTLWRSAVHLGGSLNDRVLGTLHPNATGQRVIGDAIAAQLERDFFPNQVFVRPVVKTTTVVEKVVEPRSLSVLAVIGLAVLSLLVIAGTGFAWPGLASVDAAVGGALVVVLGLVVVALGAVFRHHLLLSLGLALAGGAIMALGAITAVRPPSR
jgi:lysophospholipase L1-like esterase